MLIPPRIPVWTSFLFVALCSWLSAEGQDARRAWRVRVPVPITGDTDDMVRGRVERILGELEPSATRPTLVLHFESKGAEAGDSQFERSLALARFLASEKLNRIRTVAFATESIAGHAILPVIACEQLIMAPDAELGKAGIAESFIDGTIRQGYRDIATRRRTIPAPIVLGMLEADRQVYRLDTLDGVHYVDGEDLAKFEQTYTVRQKESMIPAAQMGNFTGRELRLKYGFVSHLAADLQQLADALEVPIRQIRGDQVVGEIRAARLNLRGPINVNNVSWSIRSMADAIRSQNVNLFLVEIESAGGDPEESLRIAQWIAELDPGEVRTVAYVPNEALGDAALVALACDELRVGPRAVLGGPGATNLPNSRRESLLEPVRVLADQKEDNWSLYYAMLAPDTELIEYQHRITKEKKYLSVSEAEDLSLDDSWQAGEPLDVSSGLDAGRAMAVGLATSEVANFDDLAAEFPLKSPPQELRRNWAHTFIAKLSHPGWARTLLFFGFLMLMIECQQPGLGVPGFVSGLCFLLFFWGQFLNGTAHWLEIMLFVAGVSCILLEVFVVPGFGVFGIGGTLMVILSIVLASQTFVLPQNEYQFERVTRSFVTLAVAFSGIIASAMVLTLVVPRVPFLRDMFHRPVDDSDAREIAIREMLVDYSHLLGARGIATTRLTPSGKARFNDDIVSVLSDGELIAKGEPIEVIEVQGSNVRVQRVNNV